MAPEKCPTCPPLLVVWDCSGPRCGRCEGFRAQQGPAQTVEGPVYFKWTSSATVTSASGSVVRAAAGAPASFLHPPGARHCKPLPVMAVVYEGAWANWLVNSSARGMHAQSRQVRQYIGLAPADQSFWRTRITVCPALPLLIADIRWCSRNTARPL